VTPLLVRGYLSVTALSYQLGSSLQTIYARYLFFWLREKTGSESGIGSSPATSYTSLNLEIVLFRLSSCCQYWSNHSWCLLNSYLKKFLNGMDKLIIKIHQKLFIWWRQSCQYALNIIISRIVCVDRGFKKGLSLSPCMVQLLSFPLRLKFYTIEQNLMNFNNQFIHPIKEFF